MRASSILPDMAKKLNERVRDEIDSHLFLFCNYEITPAHAISEDGFYHLGIQDLYKFAIDSNCIIKRYEHFLLDEKSQFEPLRKVLDQISTFRSVMDHNQSIEDGYNAKKRLAEYQDWVYHSLSENEAEKKEPETIKDYEKLNLKLYGIAETLQKYLNRFVDCVARSPKKEQWVKDWTEYTLRWYCTNTKTEIYKGQLADFYIAKAKISTDLTQCSAKKINGMVSRWIREAIYYPIDKQLGSYTERVWQLENTLNSSAFQEMVIKAPEQMGKVEQKMQTELSMCRQELFRLQKERNALESRVGNNHMDYFFKNLYSQLQRTMSELKSQEVHDRDKMYTLLPQSLIQEDIVAFFDEVPSPNGYF